MKKIRRRRRPETRSCLLAAVVLCVTKSDHCVGRKGDIWEGGVLCNSRRGDGWHIEHKLDGKQHFWSHVDEWETGDSNQWDTVGCNGLSAGGTQPQMWGSHKGGRTGGDWKAGDRQAEYGSYDAVYAALPDMISTSDLSFLEHMEITDTWKVRDQSAPPLVREASAQRLINNCRLNNEPSDPGAGLMGPSGAIWDHMGPNG